MLGVTVYAAPRVNGMFDISDETAERNHLLRLLSKAILKLEDAAAANSHYSKSLGPVRAELVQVVKAVHNQTAASTPHVLAILHRLAYVLDTMSDPLILEARDHLTSSASMVQGFLSTE
jgi:hypothetical protein